MSKFLQFFTQAEILKYGKLEITKFFKLEQKAKLKTDALAQIDTPVRFARMKRYPFFKAFSALRKDTSG